FALDEATGTLLWSHNMVSAGSLGGGVAASLSALPAQREVIAITGSPCLQGNPQGDITAQEDAFVALDWDTGETLRQYTALPGDFCHCGFRQGAVAITYRGQDYVMAGNGYGTVYALRPPANRSGPPRLLWTRHLSVTGPFKSGGIYAAPTYANGVVYLTGGPTPDGTCAQGVLQALRVTDGASIWRLCTLGQVTSASALTGTLLFVAQDNGLTAYNTATGKQVWSIAYRGAV